MINLNKKPEGRNRRKSNLKFMRFRPSDFLLYIPALTSENGINAYDGHDVHPFSS